MVAIDLLNLEGYQVTYRKICDRTGLSNHGVIDNIKRFVDKGLVRVHREDNRVKMIFLTMKGEVLLEKLHEIHLWISQDDAV